MDLTRCTVTRRRGRRRRGESPGRAPRFSGQGSATAVWFRSGERLPEASPAYRYCSRTVGADCPAGWNNPWGAGDPLRAARGGAHVTLACAAPCGRRRHEPSLTRSDTAGSIEAGGEPPDGAQRGVERSEARRRLSNGIPPGAGRPALTVSGCARRAPGRPRYARPPSGAAARARGRRRWPRRPLPRPVRPTPPCSARPPRPAPAARRADR